MIQTFTSFKQVQIALAEIAPVRDMQDMSEVLLKARLADGQHLLQLVVRDAMGSREPVRLTYDDEKQILILTSNWVEIKIDGEPNKLTFPDGMEHSSRQAALDAAGIIEGR